MRFRCSTCAEEHDLEDVSFGAEAPDPWHSLSGEERAASYLDEDHCVIRARGETHRFQRGCLEIPIRGTSDSYTWGVWVSLSEKSFAEVEAHWQDPARVRLGPHFGWLCTAIPDYPDTMFLKTRVRQRAVGLRPLVELESTAHPLAVAHREGIDPAELKERLIKLLHAP